MSDRRVHDALAEKASNTVKGWIFLAVLYGICAGVYQAWLWWDRSGYRSHVVSSQITAEGEWLPGETKECVSRPLTDRQDEEHDAGDFFADIECDKGPKHNVRIEFYGRQEQPEVKMFAAWRCTRKPISSASDAAFVCKQTAAY